jgi:glycosidase
VRRVVTVVLLLLLLLVAHAPSRLAETSELYVAETTSVLHSPGDPVYLSIADGYVVLRLFVSTRLGEHEALVVVNYTLTVKMKLQFAMRDYYVWIAGVPYTGRGFTYYFKLRSSSGEVAVYKSRSDKYFHFDGVDRFPQVEWVKYGVAYQIFPERFYNGDPSNDIYANYTDELWYNEVKPGRPVLSKWSDPITPLHCCHQYFGGDLKGVTLKLDYLSELGVTLIYLTPIFISGSAHGYDTYDHMQLDSKFGTMRDLEELISEASKQGIRVIFDFVPGHVGIRHWAFLDVYKNGPSSRYWHWFTVYKWPFRLGDGSAYRCWWGLGSLPQLNTTNPEVREYLINVSLYWLGKGFAGMRIDTPLDVLDPRGFFAQLRRAVKTRYPSAYIVGEIWDHRPEWLRGDSFDSLMNYYVGRGILLRYVKGYISGGDAARLLSDYYASIGVNVAGMNFNIIGSHDTSRVLTELGCGGVRDTPSTTSIKKLKLLSTLQYTIPGTPVVFQGDERGICGRKEYFDEQRYPIQWDRLNPEVYEHYRKLGQLKRTLAPLHTSVISLYYADQYLIAYTRGWGDELLVVASTSPSATKLKLPPGSWVVVYATDGSATVSSGELVIPPLTAVILLRADAVSTPTHTETPTTLTPAPQQAVTPPLGARELVVITGAVLAVVTIAVVVKATKRK